MDQTRQAARTANLLGALSLRLTDASSAAAASATGLTPVEVTALSVLATSLPGAPLQTLAGAVGLTQPGATRLADRLAQHGLLRRERGPDGRTIALRLTEAGEQLAGTALRARQEACSRVLAPLDDDARADLTALLERLLHPLATSTADAVRGCRLCDPVACGHHDGRCPVTRGLDARGRHGADR